MMSTKKTTHTQGQMKQFADNCHYLGLKLLAEEYPQMVDKAGKDTPRVLRVYQWDRSGRGCCQAAEAHGVPG